MARPALSASRTMDVLDFFAAFPGRAFTMADIMRATDINIASCHAVLNALAARGYLMRRGKTYLLGSALIAVGQAASETHPLIAHAQAAAAELNAALGAATMLNTVAGDEILALTSLPNQAGHFTGLRLGQRMPLIPPFGMHFMAWRSPEEIEFWLAKGETSDATQIESWRHSLILTRRRGYQVTLRTAASPALSDLMLKMAAGRQPLDYRAEAYSLAHVHDWTFPQPEQIENNEHYDVVLLAAPIFDRDGFPLLSLGLGAFTERLSGQQISQYAERLMATCVRVMQEERAT